MFLPSQLIRSTQARPPRVRSFNPDSVEIDTVEQKRILSENMNMLESIVESQKESLIFPQDKTATDIEIEFYTDYPRKFIDKYNVKPYSIQWNKVAWRISIQQLENEESAFQQLVNDVESYKTQGKQKSYLWMVKEINWLSYEKIINPDLYEKLKLDQKIKFDITLEWSEASVEEKTNYIQSIVWEEDFVGKYTSKWLKFCRVYWTIEDLEKLNGAFLWVSSIEPSPEYSVSPSSVMLQDTIQKQIFSPPTNAVNLVMMEKWLPDLSHELIEDSLTYDIPASREYSGNVYDIHATAVASLLILWSSVSPVEDIQKHHRVIPIMLWSERMMEDEIRKVTEELVDKYGIFVANLSINDYGNHFYNRSKIHPLTLILDELMHEYDVLFFVSVWNTLNADNRDPTWTKMCLDKWYPDYFWYDFTNVLPPSDSINCVSVWSIAYWNTRDSVAPRDEPAPHTRKNPNNDDHIKPDLVNFDWNRKINSRDEYESESNWVYMACHSWNNMIKKENWTSFATPICTHIAGHILKRYPEIQCNTIKALMIHFSEVLWSNTDNTLVWHGTPEIEKIIQSFDVSATIIAETTIKVWEQKVISFPIPASLQGQRKKRLRISRTLVYNPPVNKINSSRYNPIQVYSKLALWSEDEKGWWFSNEKWTTARPRSNVKKHWTYEFTTQKYEDKFWSINLRCECDQDYEPYLDTDFEQKVSVVFTIEDTQDNDVDIHQEIVQLIEQEISVDV